MSSPQEDSKNTKGQINSDKDKKAPETGGHEKISRSEAEEQLSKYLDDKKQNKDTKNEKSAESDEGYGEDTSESLKGLDVEEQLSEALGTNTQIQKGAPDDQSEENLEAGNSSESEERKLDKEKIEEETRDQIEEDGKTDEEREIKGAGMRSKEREAQQKKEKAEQKLPKIRTYKNDLNTVIKKGASMAGAMAKAAGNKAKGQKISSKTSSDSDSKKTNSRKMLIIGATVIIIGIAAGGVIFWQQNTKNEPNKPQQNLNVPSLLRVNEQKEVSTKNKTPEELLNELDKIRRGESLPLGGMMQIYLTTSNSQGKKKVLTTPEFMQKIETSTEGTLTRSLNPEFLAGIHSFDRNQPFLLFKVSSYQTAFSGMLEWEEDIKDDLSPFFDRIVKKDFTSTSNTSAESDGNFKDAVIQNHDVRILRDNSGDVLLMYSFPNTQTLIITTNKSTFKEILTRMRKPGITR